MAIPTFNDGTSFGAVRAESLNPVIEAVNTLTDNAIDLQDYSNVHIEKINDNKYFELRREHVYLAGTDIPKICAVSITDPSISPNSVIPTINGSFIHGVCLTPSVAAGTLLATVTGSYKNEEYPIEGFAEVPVSESIAPSVAPDNLIWVDASGTLSFNHEPAYRIKPIGYKINSDYYYLDADFANGYQDSEINVLSSSLGSFPYKLEVINSIQRVITGDDLYIYKHYLAKGGEEITNEIVLPTFPELLGKFWFEGINDEARYKTPPATAFVFEVSLSTDQCKGLQIRSVDPRLNIKGKFTIHSSTKDRITRFSFVKGIDQGLGDFGWYLDFVVDDGVAWVESSGEIPTGEVPVAHWWCDTSPVTVEEITEALLAAQDDTTDTRTLGLGPDSLVNTTFSLERPTNEPKYTFFAHPSDFFEDSEGNKLEPTLVNTGAGDSRDWVIASVIINETPWRTYTSPEKNLAPELHSCQLKQVGVFK